VKKAMQSRIVASIVILVAAGAVPALAQSGRVKRAPRPVETTRTQEEVRETAPPPPTRRPPSPVTAAYDVEYAGGSLKLGRGGKVRLTIRDGKIAFDGKEIDQTVPVDRVAVMRYSTTVRERTAEGIGLGTVIPGAGTVLGQSKSVAHYLEMQWSGDPSGSAIFRVDKDDYQNLILALEEATGLDVVRDPEPPFRDLKQ
jgi:hypothetical protein